MIANEAQFSEKEVNNGELNDIRALAPAVHQKAK